MCCTGKPYIKTQRKMGEQTNASNNVRHYGGWKTITDDILNKPDPNCPANIL